MLFEVDKLGMICYPGIDIVVSRIGVVLLVSDKVITEQKQVPGRKGSLHSYKSIGSLENIILMYMHLTELENI